MLIRDNSTGKAHEYGTDPHDSLRKSPDGKCLYYSNLQNGDGSMGGGYSFVEKYDEGVYATPEELAELTHRPEHVTECYFNIGGFGKGE